MSADSALWTTCKIVSALRRREIPDVRVATLFPLNENEIAFAEGPVHVDEFTTAGNGSYVTRTTFVGGTGLFGLALGAATLGASAAGNASRRAAAQAAATAQWRPVVQGSVVVTSRGFYLLDQKGKYDWDWGSIDLMQVAGFTSLVMQGRTSTGRQLAWRISSDWSELIFVLWAMARHPEHPQLLDGSWIPEGWAAWAAAQGYAPAPVGDVAIG